MIRIVRFGDPRARGEGLRLGTVRRPPRGVKAADVARLDYYDVWLPELAPSAALVKWAQAKEWTPQRWRQFVRRYAREMKMPAARHLLATLAALSQRTDFAVGCYCADASRCHRSVLRSLLLAAGARVAD